MLLPMFGFVAALLVVGGLATLVAAGDPRNARLVPYIGLFAGLGALSFTVILTLIEWMIFQSERMAGLGFVVGYVLGGLGGAAFGFYRVIQRRHRIKRSDSFNNENDHYQET